MDAIAGNLASPGRRLVRISEDDAMFAFLKSSTGDLTEPLRRRLEHVVDNASYEEKLICRGICRSIGKLEYFLSRHWFRATLDSRALRFVRLGRESGNNFSRFFSEGSYDPHLAAGNLRSWSNLNEKQRIHREKVMRYAETIEDDHLESLILCASNYVVNRRLKVFDGNHRLIAYILRHGTLPPFSCIVGFSKPRYVGLLQRALLRFDFLDETRDAVAFAIAQNLRRVRSLLAGGVNYQPLLEDGAALRRLSASAGDSLRDSMLDSRRAERLCADRAALLRDDLNNIFGTLEGRTLLDIGCNVGFFCHYFASLGVRAVGIDNNQHNRNQRFSFSDAVRTATRMNDRYDLACEFHHADARKWVNAQSEKFDVVLLLSVMHHFFLGYPLGAPLGDSGGDPMSEARSFLHDVARITGEVLYIEYEDHQSGVPTQALERLLRSSGCFESVEVIEFTTDFQRPMIRCRKR